MSQSNAKKCAFAFSPRKPQKSNAHRFYRGPHAYCAQKRTHAWDDQSTHKASPSSRNELPSNRQRMLPASPAKASHPPSEWIGALKRAPRSPKLTTSLSAHASLQICIGWVRHATKEQIKSASLLNCLSNEGMDVWLVETNNVGNLVIEDIVNFDLILFECFAPIENEMKAAVDRIRVYSRAPLLLLTDEQSATWAIDALHAGADAIFTVSTPDEVILARCNALLRRWLASA
ncbi:MAG: hypothetical protein U0350_46330 [Caldilineaceae bacterium]